MVPMNQNGWEFISGEMTKFLDRGEKRRAQSLPTTYLSFNEMDVCFHLYDDS
jgi:hypothetical protein